MVLAFQKVLENVLVCHSAVLAVGSLIRRVGKSVGDNRRNEVFAKFLKKNFPKVKSVLVVADGKGKLTRKLAIAGYKVTMVEIRKRPPHLRERNVSFIRKEFTREFPIKADLVVGMHPDEATGEIVLAAKAQRKPFAVVPCCLKGREAKGVNSYSGFMAKLRAISGQAQVTSLPISGKNLVLWRRRLV